MTAEAALPDAAAALSPARKIALGRRAYLYLLPGLLFALLVPHGLWVVLACDLVVALAFAYDLLRLRGQVVTAHRVLEPRLRVRTPGKYTLVLESQASFPLLLRVQDAAPASFDLTPLEHTTTLAPGQRSELAQDFVARERGRVTFESTHLRRESGLGLAAVIEAVHSPLEVRVLPQSRNDAARAQRGPRRELGDVAQRLRRASQGGELESLREYVPSDPLRAIDWKATAKRRHPITRLYQPERSQTLWFVLDASRTMAATVGEDEGHGARTRFDVALEALLVVADGALRAGDQVGVLVVGDGLERVVPPGRGRAQYRRLLDTLSPCHAAPVRLDVRALVGELEGRARKRALLILFTDLENEVHGEALQERAHLLTRRHLVLCVSLDDSITRKLADAGSEGGGAEARPRAREQDRHVFQRAAAIDMLRERTELTRKLEKRGVTVLEADEAGLSTRTLDEYLRIKTRGLL